MAVHSKYREFLFTTQTTVDLLTGEREGLESKLTELNILKADLSEAREVISIVGILAQQEVKGLIEELVAQALQSIFGLNYAFEVDNQLFRNKPESFLYVVKSGIRRSLKDEEEGGGVTAVVSFVLRLVMWALKSPRTAPVIGLDEPGKDISKENLVAYGQIIRKLSEMLGLQFIIVTHEDQLIDIADKSYEVIQESDVSWVKAVE